MKQFKFLLLIIVTVVFSSTVSGQQAIKFFEPNILFLYDTVTMRLLQRDATAFRIKEAQTEIKVRADIPVNDPSKVSKKPTTFSELETYVKNQVVKLNNQPGSFSFTDQEVIDYDKNVKKVGDFLCYGFVEKGGKSNSTRIFCFHISENDYTEVELKSFENKSLAQQYKVLENFFKGFKSYSKADLSNHVLANEKKYTILVKEAKEVLPAFANRTGDYLAVVTTKEKLDNKIKEVFITSAGGMSEGFKPNEKGEVYIACKAYTKGLTTGNGMFVFYSSFGKEILVPFSFQYEKK